MFCFQIVTRYFLKKKLKELKLKFFFNFSFFFNYSSNFKIIQDFQIFNFFLKKYLVTIWKSWIILKFDEQLK